MAAVLMRACARAEVTMQGEDLVMRVWNMNGQGTRARKEIETYGTEFGGWHTIVAVGLRGVQYNASETGVSSTVTYVNANGVTKQLSGWGADASANSLNIGDTGADWGPGNVQGIVGCWDPDREGVLDNARTCNMYPSSAYVQFTFSGLQNVDLTNVSFAFRSKELGMRYGQTASAEGGPDLLAATGPNDVPPTTVTPEPITMVLMGSGLAGIAAARRRKKQGKSDEAII